MKDKCLAVHFTLFFFCFFFSLLVLVFFHALFFCQGEWFLEKTLRSVAKQPRKFVLQVGSPSGRHHKVENRFLPQLVFTYLHVQLKFVFDKWLTDGTKNKSFFAAHEKQNCCISHGFQWFEIYFVSFDFFMQPPEKKATNQCLVDTNWDHNINYRQTARTTHTQSRDLGNTFQVVPTNIKFGPLVQWCCPGILWVLGAASMAPKDVFSVLLFCQQRLYFFWDKHHFALPGPYVDIGQPKSWIGKVVGKQQNSSLWKCSLHFLETDLCRCFFSFFFLVSNFCLRCEKMSLDSWT